MHTLEETAEQVAKDVAEVGRLSMVPTLLRVLCESTGMRFAAVARVSDSSWTACAVHDTIGFGLLPGGQLPLDTMLCKESRAARAPILIEQASQDPRYRDHRTPSLYGFESYVTYPIMVEGGAYFGNLCCLDPRSLKVDEVPIRAMLERFAELIGTQLDEERRRNATQSANERAVSKLREEFLAVLGHDLHDPLATVSAGANASELRALEPETVRLLDQMLKNVERVAALIDDTLNFARGRPGGGLSLQLRWSDDTAAAIEEVVEAACLAFPERRIRSRVAIDRPLRCDLRRIQQITSNLVGNAIARGSADGDIEVRAGCDAEGFELSVWNQGDPMPPTLLSPLFEPLSPQVSRGHRRALGLGLHICSEIAKAHGGSLRLSSSAREGTAFIARLPTAGPSGQGCAT